MTEPAFTRRYWKTWFETDWSAGSNMVWAQEGAEEGTRITDPEQVVLEYDPPRRLAYTLARLHARVGAGLGISEDVRARLAGERRSKVVFDLVPAGEMVKLTVVHDGFDDGSLVVGDGERRLAAVVAELKTMLETGHAADDGYDVVTSIAARDSAHVSAALTTLDGLAGWWIPTVTGSPESGGDLTLSFGEQRVVMHVDRADAPVSVVWTCRAHSRFPEWIDTRLVVRARGAPRRFDPAPVPSRRPRPRPRRVLRPVLDGLGPLPPELDRLRRDGRRQPLGLRGMGGRTRTNGTATASR